MFFFFKSYIAYIKGVSGQQVCAVRGLAALVPAVLRLSLRAQDKVDRVLAVPPLPVENQSQMFP